MTIIRIGVRSPSDVKKSPLGSEKTLQTTSLVCRFCRRCPKGNASENRTGSTYARSRRHPAGPAFCPSLGHAPVLSYNHPG